MNEQNAQPALPLHERAEDSPGFLIWQVGMCWQRKINQELAEYDITHTQFILLTAISILKKQQENVYQHQVATQARIDRMMTSRVIATLEKKKMVMRAKLSDDGRTNRVMLTGKGEKILVTALHKVRVAEKIFFSAGTNKEKEIVAYLQQILPEC